MTEMLHMQFVDAIHGLHITFEVQGITWENPGPFDVDGATERFEKGMTDRQAAWLNVRFSENDRAFLWCASVGVHNLGTDNNLANGQDWIGYVLEECQATILREYRGIALHSRGICYLG